MAALTRNQPSNQSIPFELVNWQVDRKGIGSRVIHVIYEGEVVYNFSQLENRRDLLQIIMNATMEALQHIPNKTKVYAHIDDTHDYRTVEGKQQVVRQMAIIPSYELGSSTPS